MSHSPEKDALTPDAREALHRFMHNGWACQYARIEDCRRLADFERAVLPVLSASVSPLEVTP